MTPDTSIADSIERGYLRTTTSGQLHYAQAGRGPTVLLLHQTPRSWDEFAQVMIQCQGSLHLIAMDLPGMGASSPMRDVATIEAYADAAIQLLEQLTDAPVAVCGHHTGGVVALDLAARRPDLVRSLLLSSTPWVDAAARTARAQKTPIDTVTRSRDGRHLLDLWHQRSPYYPEDVAYMDRFMADALAAESPEQGHLAVGRYHMELTAPRIHCPTLIVEHSDDPFATRHTADLHRALPHAAVKQIPGGSVALEVTAPAFADILSHWVLANDQAQVPSRLQVSE